MNRNYHHGDLRRALVDVAVELIDRDGVSSFSVAEACRRLNVSPGAPYRHFTDRNDLMGAIAIRAIAVLADHVAVSGEAYPDPVERLARSVSGYVKFAARHPALFEVVFSREVLIGTNPKMREAVRPIVEAFVIPTFELPGVTDRDASSIVVGAAAIAHGYGGFLGIGNFSTVEDGIAVAANNAAQAVRALVLGRDSFMAESGEPAIMLAGIPFRSWVDDIGAHGTGDSG
jgi:AcrR family transcriptional regulator